MLNKQWLLQRYIRFIAVVCISCYSAHAQHQNEWHMGYHSYGTGLSFNTNPPAVIPSAYNGTGSGSVITDHNGNLLFYTNGDQVWDRNHNLMPNGDGLVWTGSCGWYGARTQLDGTIIQPIPFDSNRYYIFTIPYARCMDPTGATVYYPSSLYYSIVDMRLNGGMGDVVSSEKGILIDQGLSSGGICIVPGNNCDYWLLAHTYYLSNSPYYLQYNQVPPDTVLRETGLLAYHITENGINPEPVHSVITDMPYWYETASKNIPITVSPDRTKLMVFNLLGKFDPGTGKFYDYFRLFMSNNFGNGCYGCNIHGAAFSANGEKLYVRANPIDGWGYGIYSRTGVFQFDVSDFHYYPIRQSMRVVFSQYSERTLPDEDWRSIGQVRLTPHKEIYFISREGLYGYGANLFRDHLNTITNPDADFDDLIIKEDIVYLGPDTVHHGWGLPTPVHDKLYITDTIFNTYTYLACKEQQLSIPANAINVWWENQEEVKSRIVREEGVYRATYQLPHERCRVYVDSFIVDISWWHEVSLETVPTCSNTGDGKVIIRHTPSHASLGQRFLWYNEFGISISQSANTSVDSVTGLTAGNYFVTISLDNGCDTTIHFSIEAYPWEELAVTPEYAMIKYGDSIQLHADNFLRYVWTPHISLNNAFIADPIAFPQAPVVYEVIAIDEYGCSDTGYVKIDIDYSTPDLIPNAFSPNGDGNNDVFRVEGIRFQRVVAFQVYNRWGTLIFESTDAAKGWDGTHNGRPCDMDTYYYFIQLAYPDGALKTFKGDVILIR